MTTRAAGFENHSPVSGLRSVACGHLDLFTRTDDFYFAHDVLIIYLSELVTSDMGSFSTVRFGHFSAKWDDRRQSMAVR